MNAGFSNFATLKKHLLGGSSVKTDTRFDAVILALGLGMAGLFEQFCNRKFGRIVGATQIFPADRTQFLINRYPIESLAGYELKQSEAEGFIAQDLTNVQTVDLAAGIIYFPERADVGKYFHQVRFTFTGGFWWEQLEPDDAGYPSTLPAGATALPPELFNAWMLQCRHVWGRIDKIGTDVLNNGDEKSLRFPEEFAPLVEKSINQFVRYALT